VTRYLLAAEADKIQDFIFRSARLREVVGGSQLLTRFCEEVPRLLLPPNAEVVVSDGGSFRIIFDDAEQTQTFGERLAEVYRRAAGGSLTVAKPVPINGGFGAASKQAEEALRRAKRWREGWQSQGHLPYMAFCASCGVGLAVAHRAHHEDEDPRYLCEPCLNKGAERPAGELGEFLEKFYQVVVCPEDPQAFDWPGKKRRKGRAEIDPLEDVADYDPRRYVAYLLADGNNMGKVFDACRTSDQMRTLSEGLSEAVRKALAAPTKTIMDNNPLDNRTDFIPVWPLILGGDDLFALIPAPWALDFARRFCQEYEREMSALFEQIGIQGIPCPTVSAAVVICKSKHPYTLAHEVGEKRLKEAKRMGKRLVLDGGQSHSTVDFEVVLGGRLMTPPTDKQVRPTLRPYWMAEEDALNGWGLPIKQLIAQRYELRHVPHKRLSELQGLYDPTNVPASLKSDDIEPWRTKLERLQQRIARNDAQGKAVAAALKLLGGDEKAQWRKVDRPPEDCWYGHSLPDLLEAWDFALDVEKSRSVYEEE